MALALGFAAVTLAGFALAAAGILGMFHRLKPNPFAGIRTPYTSSSEQAWYDTHRFAGPILALGGAAVLAAGLSCLPFAAAGVLPSGFAVAVLLILAVVTIGVAIAAWRHGTSRARAAAGP